MVLVITQHNLAKPRTSLAGTVMLPALKFSLDRFQLRHHPLLALLDIIKTLDHSFRGSFTSREVANPAFLAKLER